MRKLVSRPSPALVLAATALIVAVVGQAAAAPVKTTVIVRKGQIAEGAVSAKTLARGAVHPKALAKGAVTAAAIRPGAVGGVALGKGAVGGAAIGPGAIGPAALAPDSVTSAALASGSVYGGALGEETLHSAAIVDADTVPHNGEWTPSGTTTALCGEGERVISGGVVVQKPGDAEVGIITSQPFVDGGAQGWAGRITSDSGGTATAEVQALCLK